MLRPSPAAFDFLGPLIRRTRLLHAIWGMYHRGLFCVTLPPHRVTLTHPELLPLANPVELVNAMGRKLVWPGVGPDGRD